MISKDMAWKDISQKILNKVKIDSLPLRKAIVIAGGDTAVDGQNETHGFVSFHEMRALAQGVGAVSAVARKINAPIYLVDTGLEQDTSSLRGVLVKKMRNGTHLGTPAMSVEEAKYAVSLGMSVGKSLALQKVQAVALGNVGERCMLSALSVTTAVLKDDLQGSVFDKSLKIQFDKLENFKENPVSVLSKTGSTEIAMLFGLIVQSFREGIYVIFDNAVTGAAALAAVTVYPEIIDNVISFAEYDEPLYKIQAKKLNQKGILKYNFAKAQGLGSALGLELLESIISV